MKYRVAIAAVCSVVALGALVAPPAQAVPNCTGNTVVGGKPLKITFKAPASMALGRSYLAQFGVTSRSANGVLSVAFGGLDVQKDAQGNWVPVEPHTFQQYAIALKTEVRNGKAIGSNGRPVDAVSIKVRPDLANPDSWPTPFFVQARYIDSGSGQTLCVTQPFTLTR